METGSDLDRELLANAAAAAARAAEVASCTTFTCVTVEELEMVQLLMNRIWGPEVVIPRNVLRALFLAGSCILVAKVDGEPVGFALGIYGLSGGLHLHSHQVGVLDAHRSSGIGFALKLAQRSEALAAGVTEMRWTYDPLLATNARFNLERLGAVIVDFMPNCYGTRTDHFNKGDQSDRVKVAWQLNRDVGPSLPRPPASAGALISFTGAPKRTEETPAPGATIAVPANYHELRRDDPLLGDSWRMATRQVLLEVFNTSCFIGGFKSNSYVLCEKAP